MAGTEGKHYMNPHHGRHMSGKEETPPEPKGGKKGGSQGHGGKPHIHIHSHSAGHTVHVMHSDGRHESHEHPAGDTEGIASHIHENLGAGGGQPSAGDDGGDLLDGLG